MSLKVRRARARDARTLEALHTQTFPCDDHEDYLAGAWWIVWDGPEAVAFCGLRQAVTDTQAAYYSRCGVLVTHRGRGLQALLLRKRAAYVKRHGWARAITTTYCNTVSANNLIRAGFRLYDPVSPWGVDGTLYWRKESK